MWYGLVPGELPANAQKCLAVLIRVYLCTTFGSVLEGIILAQQACKRITVA